jgi:flavorubredoxin
MSSFDAVKLTDKVFWVGAIDWAVRDFHGYSTRRGTTYNAYLIVSDRITLVDTVKRPFMGEMMSRISSIVDPEKIDVIISNHSEMDHSGSLPEAVDLIGPSKVYASVMGKKALAAHFHRDLHVESVGTGDSLDIGGATLRFIETRMLHWPDSMVSYLPEDRVLFSQDGFGMHLASAERFDDQLPRELLETEARKYYANILMPFSPIVRKMLKDLKGMNLDVDLLCPDHGPIWRQGIGWIMDKWAGWAAQECVPRAVVTYDTMWGSTRAMAEAVTEGLIQRGVSVRLLPLRETHISDIVAEVLEASALVVGSPTINGRIFPSVAEFMNYVGGLKPVNLIGAAFGSYGWSGEAVGELNGLLDQMKVEVVDDGLKVQYVPDSDLLSAAVELGKKVGSRLLGQCEGDT